MSAPDSDWWCRLQAQIGQVYPRVYAWDAVNEPMVRHWCEALGYPYPLHADRKAGAHGGMPAPATMLRAWLFAGYGQRRPAHSAVDDASRVRSLFEEGGYRRLVGVGSEEDYLHPLYPGDRLSYESVLESVSQQKTTALGEGFFYSIRFDVHDDRNRKVGVIRAHELAYRSGTTP